MTARFLLPVAATLAFAGLSPVATPALAQDVLVVATDPNVIVDALQDRGYRAELTQTGAGRPMIRTQMGGQRVVVFFNACRENANCLAVQLYTRMAAPGPVTVGKLNDWNVNSVLVTATLGAGGEITASAPLVLGSEGVPPKTFEAFLIYWEAQIGRLKEFLAS